MWLEFEQTTQTKAQLRMSYIKCFQCVCSYTVTEKSIIWGEKTLQSKWSLN